VESKSSTKAPVVMPNPPALPRRDSPAWSLRIHYCIYCAVVVGGGDSGAYQWRQHNQSERHVVHMISVAQGEKGLADYNDEQGTEWHFCESCFRATENKHQHMNGSKHANQTAKIVNGLAMYGVDLADVYSKVQVDPSPEELARSVRWVAIREALKVKELKELAEDRQQWQDEVRTVGGIEPMEDNKADMPIQDEVVTRSTLTGGDRYMHCK
jgi:hypothetical protein